MNKNWLLILNPNAGGRRAATLWPDIEKELLSAGLDFDMFTTHKTLEAVDIVKTNIETGNYRKIIVIGGDGTLHEVVNGVMRQTSVSPENITIGFISIGTGNDWIKTHNISDDFSVAIKQIAEGKAIKHDVGRIDFRNDKGTEESCYFINSIGIGFDAKVIKHMLPKVEKGHSKKSDYMKGLLNTLITNKNIKGEVIADGKNIDKGIFDLAIGICRFKGGGFKLLPTAIPNDGLLDITLAGKISRLQLISCLPKLLGGKVDKINFFKTCRAKSITLDMKQPICVEADGEFLGFHPLKVSIEPSQITMISNFTDN